MNLFLVNVLLAITYAAVSDSFRAPTIFFGFILGYFVLFISTRGAQSRKYFRGGRHLVSFFFFYLSQFILASLKVTRDVISSNQKMRPGIIAIPLECRTEGEINLLANLITLTPGGISLEVSSDKKVLYVHEMYLDPKEDYVKKVKEGLEKRVLELLR